jgi:alginate O-acetyltransferase complex protein AlgI
MLFNSFQFMLFFPVVTAIYFALPHRMRALFLLAASAWFYMAFVPLYILILAFTIVVDYFAGLLLERTVGPKKKVFLVASLIANIGVLAVFKYYNFLNANAEGLARSLGVGWGVPYLSILLPIGLSFHTFQAMSYTIEVYRGHQKAERDFIVYALYVMYYPQLVAGPIERPQNLLHQFHEPKRFDAALAASGLRLMLFGLVKKVVVADRAAVVVDHVYDNPHAYSAPWLLVATAFFAFQIYADFSGYSDIARGASRVMGIELMVNFRRPYVSRSIGEFWSRWHVSLSTWFKDYLYVPMGGNRRGFSRTQVNLLVTFLVSGLWHGANWTFVVWGALNGGYLVFANLTKAARERLVLRVGLGGFPRLLAALQVASTFALVCLAWVFFRARSVQQGWAIVRTIAVGLPSCAKPAFVKSSFLATSLAPSDLLLPAVAVAVLCVCDVIAERVGGDWFERRPAWQRWSLYYAGAAAVLAVGKFGLQQFIYFQF